MFVVYEDFYREAARDAGWNPKNLTSAFGQKLPSGGALCRPKVSPRWSKLSTLAIQPENTAGQRLSNMSMNLGLNDFLTFAHVPLPSG